VPADAQQLARARRLRGRGQAAGHLAVLTGAQPGDIPIEQPTKFEMVLNVKAADVLGLSLSQELLVTVQ
jgi:ABC-type uncharacterized transport system substrate-binding protein